MDKRLEGSGLDCYTGVMEPGVTDSTAGRTASVARLLLNASCGMRLQGERLDTRLVYLVAKRAGIVLLG